MAARGWSAVVPVVVAGAIVSASPASAGWVREAPDYWQRRDDVSITRVFDGEGHLYPSLTLDVDGRSLLALREPPPPAGPSSPPPTEDGALVRFEPEADGTFVPTVLFDLARLRDPALWDAGVELGTARIDGWRFALGADGTLALTVTATPAIEGSNGTSDGALVLVPPDGPPQRILTSGEIRDDDLLGVELTYPPSATAVVVAHDRLWVRVRSDLGDGPYLRLLDVRDPDGDGDWSDREVRPLTVPATVPPHSDAWTWGDLVPEPPRQGRSDAPRAVLLPVISDDEYRVYRLVDRDGDGALTGRGEAKLLERVTDVGVEDPAEWPPTLGTGWVRHGGGWTRELVVAGLSGERSIATLEGGRLSDLLRGPDTWGIVPASDGSILVSLAGWSDEGVDHIPFRIIRIAPAARARRDRAPVEEGKAGWWR